jgi:hypothetical protein
MIRNKKTISTNFSELTQAKKRRITHILLSFLLVMACFTVSSPGHCKEWIKYENSHFIAYSRGKAKKVETLVNELELFRATALQVYRVRVPSDSPKTLVVIAKNRKELRDLGGNVGVDGFARREGQRTLIVIPSAGASSRNFRVARHEYAHALLAFENFRYPDWYNEGFAEIAALIDIDEDNNSFVLGLGTDRVLGARDMAIDWDWLISDSFNPHQLEDWSDSSAAYGQSWLLLHYLLLGPNETNAKKLAFYVANLKEGMSSVDSFQLAFNKTPAEIWETEMQDYTSQLPHFTVRFQGLTLDKEFTKTPAPEAEIQALLNYLTGPTIGRDAERLKDVPISHYIGFWAVTKFDSHCKNLIEIRHDEETESLNIRWEQKENSLTEPQRLNYTYEKKRSGNLILSRPYHAEDNRPVPSLMISARENDIMCVAFPNARDFECDVILLRCEPPEIVDEKTSPFQ